MYSCRFVALDGLLVIKILAMSDSTENSRHSRDFDSLSHPPMNNKHKLDPDVMQTKTTDDVDREQTLRIENMRHIRNRGHALSYESLVVAEPEKTDTNKSLSDYDNLDDLAYIYKSAMENEIEKQKATNNYMFGFKKWKGHVTSRPLSVRSEIVKNLYEDITKVVPVHVSTLRPSNILYVLLIGWWQAFLYCVVGAVMFVTIIGKPYGLYCFRLAKFFFWPFGKYVYLATPAFIDAECDLSFTSTNEEHEVLIKKEQHKTTKGSVYMSFFKSPLSYLWLLIGFPVLSMMHFVAMVASWIFVISIPIAKVNFKALTYLLFLPPNQVSMEDYTRLNMKEKHVNQEIIMYTHRSVYVYYYKYTVDGMNIILVNLLIFVIMAIAIGYSDTKNEVTSGAVKCIIATLAIIPLTYYVGLSIVSISAQSSFAVGAILNATFGSIVDLIIMVVTLNKGTQTSLGCFQELVKSSLTGTIVGSILFIPGMCMIVGGIKHHSQRYNPKFTNVSALLLFVAVIGVYAASIFAKIFGDLQCAECRDVFIGNSTDGNFTLDRNYSLHCAGCKSSLASLDGGHSLYLQHLQPLVYACAILLPITYIVGMIFTLKTHSTIIQDEEKAIQKEAGGEDGLHHGTPSWSRLKSIIILLVSATFIALCADLITENIQKLLEATGISEYFIGMTMIAMIPELPEIVNGIQFALYNNVSLGIEIGTSTAIQVCMIQMPMLVLINLIYPFHFQILFNDIHLYSVIFSIIVINYTFQDGKSDYFQGFALVAIYLVLLCMYFFIPVPGTAQC